MADTETYGKVKNNRVLHAVYCSLLACLVIGGAVMMDRVAKEKMALSDRLFTAETRQETIDKQVFTNTVKAQTVRKAVEDYCK